MKKAKKPKEIFKLDRKEKSIFTVRYGHIRYCEYLKNIYDEMVKHGCKVYVRPLGNQVGLFRYL